MQKTFEISNMVIFSMPGIYELLKNNLYQDDAVTGEAAGLAMGLVMLGKL